MKTILGEFGKKGGHEVVLVKLVDGYYSEIRHLWKMLNDADAIEEDEIFARLYSIGAVIED